MKRSKGFKRLAVLLLALITVITTVPVTGMPVYATESGIVDENNMGSEEQEEIISDSDNEDDVDEEQAETDEKDEADDSADIIDEEIDDSTNIDDVDSEDVDEESDKDTVSENEVSEEQQETTVSGNEVIDEEKLDAADPSWYSDYNYTLDADNHQLIITSSKGTFADNLILDVIIPAETVINGVSYVTVLSYSGDKGLWYNDRNMVETITIENGVKLRDDCSYLFANLTNLIELDITNWIHRM